MNASVSKRLRKAACVVSKTLGFRDATANDAALILSLRTDAMKSRYISAVSGELIEQQTWLQQQAKAADQAYVVIEYQDKPIGTVRLYDPQCVSFCWGS